MIIYIMFLKECFIMFIVVDKEDVALFIIDIYEHVRTSNICYNIYVRVFQILLDDYHK